MTNISKNKLLNQLNFLKSIGFEYHESLSLSTNSVDNINLPNDMYNLKDCVEHCYLCELSKSRKNILFGQGNINSDIMFIGDIPSVSEDEEGHYFLGRSGEILSKMIENVLLLDTNEVYITNIVKCRPNGNDLPKDQDIHTCSSYLHKQIELVKPKIIVCLGEMAYKHFIKDDNINFLQVRGQVQNIKNIMVIPTFHPSFLLRNPSLKKESYLDMLKIKNLMESIN